MSTETIDNRFVDIPTSALIFSVGLHLCAPFLLVGLHVLTEKGFFPGWKPRNVPKQAYQSFIQVDVVGLPDNLISEKKKVDVSLPVVDKAGETKEVVKTADPKEDELALQEKETAKENAKEALAAKRKAEEAATLEKEKTRQKEQDLALKRLNDEAAREAALKSLGDKNSGKAGRQKISGNITSKGTAMTGMIGNASDQYASRLKAAIEQHFSYYPWQKKKSLVNRVYLEIFPNGRAKLRAIVKPSGDKVFDSAVLQAVDSAQPFPLPSDLSILSDGIEIEFKPEAK